MRRQILIAIAACFYYSGLVALARSFARRSGPRLIVLIYHGATGGDLRRHWLYLRRHYQLVHLENGLEELHHSFLDKDDKADNDCLEIGSRHLDKSGYTPLAVTCDDGYADNYTDAFALAKELQIPFTIYLIPGYLEKGGYFWWLERKHLVRATQVREVTIDERTYHLDQQEDRRALSRWIDSRARYASSVAEREKFLHEIYEKLQISDIVDEKDIPAMPLTWEQVLEMDRSGLVSFGAHTMNHPVLSCLTDTAEVQYEVSECRTVLEQHLGHPIRSLAYPIGQQQHISEQVLDAVKNAGYSWAVTSHYGFNTPQTDPYLLKRIEVDVDQHWLVMAAEAAGLWGFFARLRWIPFLRKHLTNSRI